MPCGALVRVCETMLGKGYCRLGSTFRHELSPLDLPPHPSRFCSLVLALGCIPASSFLLLSVPSLALSHLPGYLPSPPHSPLSTRGSCGLLSQGAGGGRLGQGVVLMLVAARPVPCFGEIMEGAASCLSPLLLPQLCHHPPSLGAPALAAHCPLRASAL